MDVDKARKNILIACTGSVAAIKTGEIIEKLHAKEFEVKVITTASALHFLNRSEVKIPVPILKDEDEWSAWQGRNDPIIHIDLCRWADALLIAPLDANTLAKIATGICDNLVTCTVRAWIMDKPLFFCPAMNTRMYEHPITDQQIRTLRSWGYHEIACVEKKLMCGDSGLGAMECPTNIVQRLIDHFG